MMPLLLALLFQGKEFGVRVEVQAIEVSASVRDASGKLPRDLKPEDFVLLEDGKPQRVIGVAYVDSAAPHAVEETPHPRQVVVFIQQSLATTDGLRIAMTSLATQVETLVAMGEVEVVTDLPRPHSLLGPTRDATALRALLERMGKEAVGDEELIQMRRAFLIGDSPAVEEIDVLARSDQIRMRAQQEAIKLAMRQDAMLAWLGRYPRREAGTARALLYVSDGFDLDPRLFYTLDRNDIRVERQAELRDLSAVAHYAEVAQTLAAQGWTVVSMAMASNVRRMTDFKLAPRDRGSMDVLGNSKSAVINRAPLAPLRELADASGGSVLTDPAKISSELQALDTRVIITYQVDRPADEKIRRVEVRSNRSGLTVQAQRWVGTRSTEAMAEATATGLATSIAEGGKDRGELPVSCSITLGPAIQGIRSSDIEVKTDATSSLRITIAVVNAREKPFTFTRSIETSTTTIGLRHRDGARIGLVVVEPESGDWGSCRPGDPSAAARPQD